MLSRLKILLVLSCFWSTLSCAAENYGTNPAALALVDELVQEQGFDRETLMQVFTQAERQESILKAIARPAEKTKAWYEYRQIFINDKRIAGGVDFHREHYNGSSRCTPPPAISFQFPPAAAPLEQFATTASKRSTHGKLRHASPEIKELGAFPGMKNLM